MQSVAQKIRTGLLEFRTSKGSLYAVPSFRERLYLLWIFRHFRSLSRPVLSAHQQKLIDKLWCAAEENDYRHISRASVIGAVENLGAMPARNAASGESRVIQIAASQAKLALVPAVGSEARVLPPKQIEMARVHSKRRVRKAQITEIPGRKDATGPSEDRGPSFTSRPKAVARTWREWGYGAVLAIALVGVVFYVNELRPWSIAERSGAPVAQLISPQSSSSAETRDLASHDSAGTSGATPVAAALPPSLPKIAVSTESHSSVPSHTGSAHSWPASSTLAHVTGAPAAGFTYPDTPDAGRTGVVHLKALIAADGTVKEVAVLSGKRALASYAVRAVRHWKYPPSRREGQAVEAETSITFNFVGPDAVSISFPSALE